MRLCYCISYPITSLANPCTPLHREKLADGTWKTKGCIPTPVHSEYHESQQGFFILRDIFRDTLSCRVLNQIALSSARTTAYAVPFVVVTE